MTKTTQPTEREDDTKPKLTHNDLRQFTGDLDRYRHPLNRNVIYTPGVKYLADKAGAYWLIDAIASYFGSPQMKRAMKADYRIKDLQFWNLEAGFEDGSAILTARADKGVKPFISQRIDYTDFPLDRVDIWAGYDGEQWTLYLPSEH